MENGEMSQCSEKIFSIAHRLYQHESFYREKLSTTFRISLVQDGIFECFPDNNFY